MNDAAACYFLQYVVDAQLKAKPNAERAKSESAGKEYKWRDMLADLKDNLTHTADEEEVLTTLLMERAKGLPLDVGLANIETAKAVAPQELNIADKTWAHILVA